MKKFLNLKGKEWFWPSVDYLGEFQLSSLLGIDALALAN